MTYSIFYSSRSLEFFLWVISAVSVASVWLFPRFIQRLGRRAALVLSLAARRQWLAISIAAAVPTVVRLALLPVLPFPQPAVHDEFSNLLAGDTLAHGRLTNPTPPYWQHFETEYELLKPTYASQYQPGEGLVLAAGQVAGGHPWWGVWFSTGLLFAVLVWALGSVMPAQWALFASMIAALQFGIFGFWMNSYFGGSVPAIGGALAFGALAHGRRRRDGLRRRRSGASIGLGVTCGAGLWLLFATRPVEGLIWAVATFVFQAQSVREERLPLVPLALSLLTGLSFLAFYNQRITGHPAMTPYLQYRQTYGTPQSYWWQPAAIVSHFDYPELQANYQDQLRYWRRRDSPAALWNASWRRLRDFWRFFIGPLLTPAVLFLLFSRKRVRLRFWLWLSIAFMLDHATYHAWYPQQSASETVLITLLLIEGWRHLRVWRRERGSGLALSRGLAAGLACAVLLLGAGLWARAEVTDFPKGASRILAALVPPPRARDRAIGRLQKLPGKHLVFVHYRPGHPWYDEWVFNGADLPNTRILFSRMWTPDSDLALARSMPDRDLWLAEPDAQTPLSPIAPEGILAVWQKEAGYAEEQQTTSENRHERH